MTEKVSKAPEAKKKVGPRILIPKGYPITFVYAPSDMKTPSSARAVLERLVREYALAGGPAFTVTQDSNRLHVVPDQVLDASGAFVHQSSILETVITVPAAQRNGGQLLEAICDAIRNKTGIEIEIGPSTPSNYLARFDTKDGVTNLPAAKAIANLLDAASPKAIFDWDLYFDPADKSYMLNFAYVGPAAIICTGAASSRMARGSNFVMMFLIRLIRQPAAIVERGDALQVHQPTGRFPATSKESPKQWRSNAAKVEVDRLSGVGCLSFSCCAWKCIHL